MADPSVSILVPRRFDQGRRDVLWCWVRRWWEVNFPAWRIFEGHDPGPGPFNRSAAVNRAAAEASSLAGADVYLVIDGDVVPQGPRQILDAVELAHRSGRMTIGHDRWRGLDRPGSDRVMGGWCGNWGRYVTEELEFGFSNLVAFPVELFELLGGFDERFVGWGFEDTALAAAAKTLAGGLERVHGDAYHLWHETSRERNRKLPDYQRNRALSRRYYAAAGDPPAIVKILEERPGVTVSSVPAPTGDEVVVAVFTVGRRDYLLETLETFRRKVSGPMARFVIFDDSGDPDFGEWLRRTIADASVVSWGSNLGYTAAMGKAWRWLERHTVEPFVFHLEEDFRFDADVELGDLEAILRLDENAAQVALMRHPFFDRELKAGSIIAEHPDEYRPRSIDGLDFLVHSLFFTANPSLYGRELLAVGWPTVPRSEAALGDELRKRGLHFAYLGDGTPQITHIGTESTGTDRDRKA